MGFCYPCRDAVNDLALHFLAKMKIMVIKDIEREDIEFVCKVGFLGTSSSVPHSTHRCLYAEGNISIENKPDAAVLLIWHDIRNIGYFNCNPTDKSK